MLNWQKSVLTPVQEIEFLGLTVNSRSMTLSLTEEKMAKIKSQCQDLYHRPCTTILELTRLLGRLSSTIQAILPARIQFRHLQHQQILALKQSQSFLSKVVLGKDSLEELKWWIENIKLSNGRNLIQPTSQTLLQTDASLKGWGQIAEGFRQEVNGPL